ncbi:MAG: hypothetical protein ACI8ZB_005305 [Desulforhopalus sp.]|jgi:hypothetical protein
MMNQQISAMDKIEISNTFTKKNNANWNCPKCNRVLVLKKNSFHAHESSETQLMLERPDCHQMEYSYVFSCLFHCTNNGCNEHVACTGEGFHDIEISHDNEGYPVQQYPIFYKPKYFFPNVNLFPLSNNVPKDINLALSKSFELFFCNYDAALNQVRICIELLMDSWGIASSTETNKFISLHTRITKIPEKYSKLKSVLTAVKWLGNAGSHSSVRITKKDLLDAYEIVNYILIEVFSSKHEKISGMANEINTSKGPRNTEY